MGQTRDTELHSTLKGLMKSVDAYDFEDAAEVPTPAPGWPACVNRLD